MTGLGTNYRADGTGRDHYIQFNNGGNTRFNSSAKNGVYGNLSSTKLMSGYRTAAQMRAAQNRKVRAWSTTAGAAYSWPKQKVTGGRSRRIRTVQPTNVVPRASVHPYGMGLLFSYDRTSDEIRPNQARLQKYTRAKTEDPDQLPPMTMMMASVDPRLAKRSNDAQKTLQRYANSW
jgi:hypothetical protein